MKLDRKPRVLMCPPDHFSVAYSINPWMDPASWASEEQALAAESRREWEGLHRVLQERGAAIELITPALGLPDLVFTANGAVVLDGVALLAHFRHAERQGEEIHFERAFQSLIAAGLVKEMRRLPEGIVLEGAGDCVWDQTRLVFWMGYGQRSDAAAGHAVEAIFGVEVVRLQLADARFYHMDTALCPLPGGEVMYFPGAFTPAGLAEIHARVEPDLRIEVTAEDAGQLAVNTVALGDALVLSACSEAMQHRLNQRGYRVCKTPLNAFQRSGGSAFCLTLRLDNTSGAVASKRPPRQQELIA